MAEQSEMDVVGSVGWADVEGNDGHIAKSDGRCKTSQ